jgi:ABC-2 type transport system ATP-binding protein
MAADVVDARVQELLVTLGLSDAEPTLIADYSTGMRKKIGLAAAVLHGPAVLVLDEPLEAVDPVSALTVVAILEGFTAHGGTVLLSTHTMANVEQLCDHVAILDQGRLLRAGSVQAVSAGHTLSEALVGLVGADAQTGGLSWFAS